MHKHTNLAISLCAIAIFAAAALYQQLQPLTLSAKDTVMLFVMSSIYSASLSLIITTILFHLKDKLYHPPQRHDARQWLFDGATSLLATAPASVLGFLFAQWLSIQSFNFNKLAPITIFLSAGLIASSAYLTRVITKRAHSLAQGQLR